MKWRARAAAATPFHGPLQLLVSRRSDRTRRECRSRTTRCRPQHRPPACDSEGPHERPNTPPPSLAVSRDAADSHSSARNSGQQVRGPPQAIADRAPRIPASRDDSKLSGLAFGVRATSGFAEFVELSGSHIGFDLCIPRLRVLLHEPIAELRELFARQLRDLTLNFLEFSHGIASGREVYLSGKPSSANAAVQRPRGAV